MTFHLVLPPFFWYIEFQGTGRLPLWINERNLSQFVTPMNLIIILVIIAITALLIWIFLTSREETAARDVIEEKTQEKILRRRASDKEIEEEIPERRRSTDQQPPASGGAAGESQEERPFKLPYLTDEIIPPNSRFRVYRRTLLNSEVYAGKGLYSTSISLYEGVSARINDAVTRNKIEENIRYLRNYSQSRSESRYKSDRSDSVTSGDLKFTVDGNTQRKINIEVINNSTEQTIENLREEIKKKILEDMEKIRTSEGEEKSKETEALKHEIRDMKDLMGQLNEEKERMQERFRELKTREAGEAQKNEEMTALRDEIRRLRELEDMYRKGQTETERLKEIQELTRSEKEEIQRLNDEIRRLKKAEEQSDETRAELARLNDELNRMKSARPKEELPDTSHLNQELDRIQDRLERMDSRERLQEKEDRKIRDLNDQIRNLEEKLQEMSALQARGQKEQPPIVMDTTPLIELFNKLYSDRSMLKPPARQEAPQEMYEEPDDEDVFEKIIKDGMKEKEKKKDKEEKVEEKTTITREKTEEDKNEFDVVSDYVKDKGDGDLSDEEIFEKILRDDKKGKSEEESFEIRGFKSPEEGQYDILSRDQEMKRREDENFYKSFIKSTRKLKKELPILKVNFDFTKLPDEFSLSKEKNILEYSFYKYKPMLEKAGELIKKRKVREAIDYYRVVMDQNIPNEFKLMIKKNINDLTEYLEKYLTSD